MQKKGEMSRLTINLLIGLLILVLVAIIFIIIRGYMNEPKQEVLSEENLDFKISQVKQINENTLGVTVRRNIGEGNFVGLSFVVSDGKITEIIKINTSIQENESEEFSIDVIQMNVSKVKSISISPIYMDEEGSKITGGVKDEYINPNVCSTYCPSDAQCGINGCGLPCGNGCAKGYFCLNYKCIKEKDSSGGGSGSGGSTCKDTCSSLGYECGTYTICGKSVNCGTCDNDYTCVVNGTCVKDTTCVPNCVGKQCGDNGCGGSCGTCSTGYNCETNGTCIKIPENCTVTTYNPALNTFCGSRSVTTNCGTTVTMPGTLTCTAPNTCGGNGTANTCGCTVSSYTPALNTFCGSRNVTTNCGTTVTRTGTLTCTAPETCAANGTCMQSGGGPTPTGAIIANHSAVNDFDIIPSCWIQKAKNEFVIGYGHTSHGSQITTGLAMVRTANGSLYSYNDGGTGGALDYEEGDGYGNGWLDHDVGYGGWDDETRRYLNGYDSGASPSSADHSDVNTIMWSWCGQASGYSTYASMNSHYLSRAESIVSDYGINFIYMTGHLEGSGTSGNLYKANNVIRQHVQDINGVLFDFADIESYSPDGTYYSGGSDGCEWCSTWCSSHSCPSCGSCAHSHCFNCYNKGKAFWWMMARMAGWDGTAGASCP